MLNSKICGLLDIKYPVFQGGMAWIAEGTLAAAVSNGGGLGLISAMNADANYLRREIAVARELTGKPFGVNIMLMSPYADEVAQIVIDENIKIITTGAGLPSKYMRQWLDAGIKVIPVIASVASAKMAARSGAAAVIAEGSESGGHIGEISTMALVPQVCDAVDVPVIAAGGIADGRGMAAAFMLGAVGIQMGTRFLSAIECKAHQNFKNLVLKASDISTIVTGRRFGGHVLRCLKTEFSRNFIKLEYDPDATAEKIADLGIGSVRRAAIEGDLEKGSFLAGQIAGLVKKEQPAAEIISEICGEAENLLINFKS